MPALSFTGRAWDAGARIQVALAQLYSHVGTSSSDPSVYATRGLDIDWGDGTTESFTLNCDGGTSSGGWTLHTVGGSPIDHFDHDYAGDPSSRTIVITVDWSVVTRLRVAGCGLTAIPSALFSTLTDCQDVYLDHNFLDTLGSADPADAPYLRTLDLSWNHLTGTTPSFASDTLRRLAVQHNGYTVLGDLAGFPGLLQLDASYNPIASYAGSGPPVDLYVCRLNHCAFPESTESYGGVPLPSTVDRIGGWLAANLTSSDTVVKSHSASVRGDMTFSGPYPGPITDGTYPPSDPIWFSGLAVPVVWVTMDLATPNLVAVLPWDGSGWPDPAIVGEYDIASFLDPSDPYAVPAHRRERVTVVSKSGSVLHARFEREADWLIGPPMYHYSSSAGGAVMVTGAEPPNGTEYWYFWQATSPYHDFRNCRIEGGENAVPSSTGQTDWTTVRHHDDPHWSGSGGPDPIYNAFPQDQGRPRVCAQYGDIDGFSLGSYRGDDVERSGWTGKHVLPGDTASTTDMQTVRAAFLQSGIAHHKRALVCVWYRGLPVQIGAYVWHVKLNGTALERLGNPISEDWFGYTPEAYNLECFLSDELDVENLCELELLVQDTSYGGTPTEITWAVCFVRDASGALVSTLDRGTRVPDYPDGSDFPPDNLPDPSIGLTDWHQFAAAEDLVVVAAGAYLPTGTSVSPTPSTLYQGGESLFGSPYVADVDWQIGDQNPGASGTQLFYRTGVLRDGGPDSDTLPAYWTPSTPPDDWRTVGGAARLFVFHPRTQYPLPLAPAYAAGPTGDALVPIRRDAAVPDGAGHSMGQPSPYYHRLGYPAADPSLGTITHEDGSTEPVRLIHVSIGRDHLVAIASDGQVYTAGAGDRGQLGQGDTLDHADLTWVERLADPPAVEGDPWPAYTAVWAWAGDGYSIVLTDDGALWLFGQDNGTGLFGIDPTDPLYVDVNSYPVKQDKTGTQAVGCNGDLLLIDGAGLVWHRGSNAHGQRGDGVGTDADPHPDWAQITAADFPVVDAIRTNALGSVLVRTADHLQVWAWGTNGDGSGFAHDYLTNTGSGADPLLEPTHLAMWDATTEITAIGLFGNAAVCAIVDGVFKVTGNSDVGQTGSTPAEGATAPDVFTFLGLIAPLPEHADWMEILSPFAFAVFVRGVSGKLYGGGYNRYGDVQPHRQGAHPAFDHCFLDYAMTDTPSTYRETWSGVFPDGAKMAGVQAHGLGTLFWMAELPPVVPPGGGSGVPPFVAFIG